ncbi:hypothetical protein HYH03_007108 [Edaphochlamys debaryana]|uniref:Uncharacterized protein n=1 Tax=Edaphochlamys debaryana TaxID=47281 RepID=A0A835YC95_9CHLO|nr:hypothetical protein HYH03_007108 [Edaphochlamys debaryana]|eukprot:KAG2494869.1 hypothetical protein HYH03_007108 [Edaphochlamys debaryana]
MLSATTRSAGFAPSKQQRRAARVSSRQSRLTVRASAEPTPEQLHPEDFFSAETIAFNAKHLNVLRQRIAQVRANEVVGEAGTSRPEKPDTFSYEQHRAMVRWHEQQWENLRKSQANPWEDELGHFGCSS